MGISDDDFVANAKFMEPDPEAIRKAAGLVPDFDSHGSIALLPPSKRLEKPPSTLSDEVRRKLVDMIYDVHYKSLATDGAEGIKAMRYQAGLEVAFIEDHVESQAAVSEGKMNREDVRKKIKKHVMERVDLQKPLSYILGHQPFFGCYIECVQPLLCPRSETELWTHWLCTSYLNRASEPFTVLDVCCGTGCIGVAIAKNATASRVLALDVMIEAVEVSNRNAKHNHLAADCCATHGADSSRYMAVQSDMFEWLEARGSRAGEVDGPGSFDVVVSNPPYILPDQYRELPPTITLWESKMALVGDPSREDRQYLYFQELCNKGAKYLKPAADRQPALREAPSICIEIGLQGDMVASIMEMHPEWRDVELHTDFSGQPRWVTAKRK